MVTRPTDRFQSDASKLSLRGVLMIKCTSVFSYSIYRKNKNFASLALPQEVDIGKD